MWVNTYGYFFKNISIPLKGWQNKEARVLNLSMVLKGVPDQLWSVASLATSKHYPCRPHLLTIVWSVSGSIITLLSSCSFSLSDDERKTWTGGCEVCTSEETRLIVQVITQDRWCDLITNPHTELKSQLGGFLEDPMVGCERERACSGACLSFSRLPPSSRQSVKQTKSVWTPEEW